MRKPARGAWVVTGAASGFGRELAVQLTRRGDAVALWDRDPGGLQETVALLGHEAQLHTCTADVTDPASLEKALVGSRAALGPIAHAVNCAGVLRVGPALEVSTADYELMMRINALGTIYFARVMVPELRSAASASGGLANLMLVASVAGLRGFPELAGYSATKHAVVGFGRALADELAGTGVSVRVLCPPTGDTPMVRNLPYRPKIYDLAPALSAETIVTAALRGLERPGFLILVDARTKALFRVSQVAPAFIDQLVRRTTRER